jgi:hypothetical protein
LISPHQVANPKDDWRITFGKLGDYRFTVLLGFILVQFEFGHDVGYPDSEKHDCVKELH